MPTMVQRSHVTRWSSRQTYSSLNCTNDRFNFFRVQVRCGRIYFVKLLW